MYLKQLEMQGFKSFPDRTKILFHPGTTVIVGPNGSGKSNITDAMRWVLGEISSRNIRGTKMEDVIFAGADGRSPMSYAEVSITFDNSATEGRLNSPYDEITVTRRYYKSGDSEYYINKRAVRLKDIHELFMNTGIGREGYSIIGQGKIAEIISRKSEDRRTVFEEAAGISKFRYRKQESIKSLDETEKNMLRVADIMTEIESRLGPLEKEAEKARRYLELYERKRRADIALIIYDVGRMREELRRAEDAYLLSEHELEVAADTVAQLEAQSERISEAAQEERLSSERTNVRIREMTAELARIDGECRAEQAAVARSAAQAEEYKKSSETTSRLIAEAKSDAEAVAARLADAKRGLDEANAAVSAKRAALEEIEGRLSETEAKLDELFREMKKREDAAVDLKVRLNVLRGSREDDERKRVSVLAEIEKYESAADDYAKKAAAEEKTASEYAAAIAELDREGRASDEKLADVEREISRLSEESGRIRGEIEAITHKIDVLVRLEENFEGYGRSVKYVMDGYASGAIRGTIYGPVSHIISTDKQYVTAIETALGANLQNIVVDNEETAKEAINYLKAERAGRATFYPIASVKAQEPGRETREASKYPGYVGMADSLVRTDARFSEIIRYLLGRTCVFADLDAATVAAKATGYKIRAVTLDGQQINVGGSFTGGSARRESGMLTRSEEIKTLQNKKAEIEQTLKKSHDSLSDAAKRRSALVSASSERAQRRELLETMMRAAASEGDTFRAQEAASRSLAQSLKEDLAVRAEQNERSSFDIEALAGQCERVEAEAKELRDARAKLDVLRHEIIDQRDAASAALSAALVESTRIKSEASAAEEMYAEKMRRLREYEAQLASYKEKIEELEAAVAASQKKEAELKEKYDKVAAELAGFERERGELEANVLEYERRQTELRRKIREKTEEKERAVRVHMKNEQRKNDLAEAINKTLSRLWDDYELSLSAAEALDYPTVTEKNRRAFVSELTECRNKLRAIGGVNVSAIDEYKEVRERYDYLSRQMEDLRTAKDDLTAIINDLDREMERCFMDAFKKIAEKFTNVFRELFGGGNAEIYLTDPDNVLTSGIEIKAAPPGKVIKNMSLLSGGEQAFVAIALLFAMIEVSPTPFCIFDEIESSLDEVNVDRFAQYMKRYSNKMQFIAITHRRGTMEIADVLYGITMPRHGISRVLTLDTSDVEAKNRFTYEGVTDGVL